MLVMMARRWYRKQFTAPMSENFTIEDLERMHTSGHITRAEFTRLRIAAMGLDGSCEENSKTQSSSLEELDDESKDIKEG